MKRRTGKLALGAAAVILLSAALNLYGNADLPFYTAGEPREAIVVWEMAHGGGLVFPTQDASGVAANPPFFHWLALAVSTLRGTVDELSTRLPSGLLATILTLGIYLFAAGRSRIRCGWLAAVALTTSLGWLQAARTAQVDMTFTALVSGAVLLFAAMERSGFTPVRRALFFALVGAAAFTMGPIGLFLPTVVVLVHVATSPHRSTENSAETGRNVLRTMRELSAGTGIAAVLTLLGLWYVGAWALSENTSTQALLQTNGSSWHPDGDGSVPGWFAEALGLVVGFLWETFPWSLSAPAIAWWLWRQRPLDDTRRLLLVWFFVSWIFVLFPVPGRGIALLPAYPAAALLFGLVLGPGPDGVGPRRLAAWGWLIGTGGLFLLGGLGLAIAAGAPLENWGASWLRPVLLPEFELSIDALRQNGLTTGIASALVILAALAAAANAPGAHWLRASVPLALASAIALWGLIAPMERAIADNRSFAAFLPRVLAEVGDAPLAFDQNSFDPGARFYARRRIPTDRASRSRASYLLHRNSQSNPIPQGFEELLRSSAIEGVGPRPLSLLRAVNAVPTRPSAGESATD